MHEAGGNYLKHLGRGWNKEEGKGNKDFKKGAKLDQGLDGFKKGGWNLLTNYDNTNYNSTFLNEFSEGLFLFVFFKNLRARRTHVIINLTQLWYKAVTTCQKQD